MDAEGFMAISFYWSSYMDLWYEHMLQSAFKIGKSHHSQEFSKLEKLISSFQSFLLSIGGACFFTPNEVKLMTSSHL